LSIAVQVSMPTNRITYEDLNKTAPKVTRFANLVDKKQKPQPIWRPFKPGSY